MATAGRAMASCGSCGHVWPVDPNDDPKKCPECGWEGAITVSVQRSQRTKRRTFGGR